MPGCFLLNTAGYISGFHSLAFWSTLQDCDKQALVALLVEDDTVVLLLEPLHGVVLDELVLDADAAGLPAAVAHVHALAAEHDVEVHAVDTDGGVVLDAEIDVFGDSEAEVAVLGEVVAAELVLADLEK